MIFAKDFFDLQFSFAERIRDLSRIPLEVALFEYTNFYVRLGLGRDFDADHPGWQSYLSGLRDAGDGRDWTYEFYLRDAEARTAPPVVATFGCFSYARPDGRHVRLHFRNTEDKKYSPLEAQRVPRRCAELSALFAHMEPEVSDDTPVVGASWMYNLAAYRRLFPPGYASSGRAIRGGYRSMPLWGQFLDRHGRVRAERAEPFLSVLAQTSELCDLDDCFPLHALTVSAPAREFYEFYDV